MDFSLITFEVANAVATITLARPELHNAFNDKMIAELTEAFKAAAKDSNIRVVILAAQGKSFCAGADLNWMQSMLQYSYVDNVIDAMHLAKMLEAIATCPKPVIGRIHGAAFGGGVGLTSACDLVAAVEPATFALTEVKLGLLPAVISPFVLKKIPVAQAQRYFLTAERFTAQTACQMGLVSQVVADEAALDALINQWIENLKVNAPEALGLAKSLIADVAGMSLEKAMPHTADMIAKRRISSEGQEGMTAFLEKRSPNWVEAKN